MSEDPTQSSGNGSDSSDLSMSDLIWLLIGVAFLLSILGRIWSFLVDFVGHLGAMGVTLLIAGTLYIIIFVCFLRKSNHPFRIPMSQSTRIFGSLMVLSFVALALTDLGILKAIGIATLCAIVWYIVSFILFQRRITHSFRVPMDDWLRVLVAILVGPLVSTPLDVGFLGELGYGVLFCVGTHWLSYLFFSKKVDSPQATTDAAGTSESS